MGQRSAIYGLISNERRKAIRAIKRLVTPHFRESGYRTAVVPGTLIGHPSGRRPVMLWAPPGRWVDVPGCYNLSGFVAITEFGPMTDAHGGGMVWESWSSFPLEDLLKIREWAQKTFAPTARAALQKEEAGRG